MPVPGRPPRRGDLARRARRRPGRAGRGGQRRAGRAGRDPDRAAGLGRPHEARRGPAAGAPPSATGCGPARNYELYWGDLHRHSLVSRCTAGDEPSLEDFYRYAWDVNEYDFWAVTDHAENSTAYQWWSIQKIADLLHVPGRFVPLYGFEWTSADSGHQNVIYGDVARGAPIFSAFAEGSSTPAGLWRGLAEHPEFPAVTIPHHPGSAMVYNDWDYHDPRYSRLVEVFQACRGNYESPACFRQYSDGTATGTFMIDGLRRGHRFGLIASSDHGHGASYVAVLARSLSRGDVFDGLCVAPHLRGHHPGRARRPAAGPHLMGSEVEWSGPRRCGCTPAATPSWPGWTSCATARWCTPPAGEPPWRRASCGWTCGWNGARRTRSTRWDGRLTVSGGRLLLPEFVGPEVVAMDAGAVGGSTPRTASASPTARSAAASRSASAGPGTPRSG